MDIGLDSSVVEHLTSDAGVLGLIPDHAIYFHLCISVNICLNTLPIPSILKPQAPEILSVKIGNKALYIEIGRDR